MCADVLNLERDINALKNSGATVLHIDVMDGEFVPNIMLGTELVKRLKKNCSMSLDLHLMIKDPEKKLDWFAFGDGDTVSVHYESGSNIKSALEVIKSRGAESYIAINPATDISVVDQFINIIDGVLLMTVNPGAAGQPICDGALDKITSMRKRLSELGKRELDIQVDGCVSFEYAPKMKMAGANNFVAGTSSVFHRDGTIEENYGRLKSLLEEKEN